MSASHDAHIVRPWSRSTLDSRPDWSCRKLSIWALRAAASISGRSMSYTLPASLYMLRTDESLSRKGQTMTNNHQDFLIDSQAIKLRGSIKLKHLSARLPSDKIQNHYQELELLHKSVGFCHIIHDHKPWQSIWLQIIVRDLHRKPDRDIVCMLIVLCEYACEAAKIFGEASHLILP